MVGLLGYNQINILGKTVDQFIGFGKRGSALEYTVLGIFRMKNQMQEVGDPIVLLNVQGA